MPTMKDVADRAGVSATTVSHVVNDTRPVSEGRRQRVLDAMQALGYRPNRLARSLRRGHSQTLGLILPDIADPFFAEIARSIEDAGYAQGYSVILCNSDQNLDKELFYTQLMIDKRVDGVLFAAVGPSAEHIESLQHWHIPLVIVDRDVASVHADIALIDDRHSGYLAGKYLAGLGHRRIGFINYPILGHPSPRILGAMQAMREVGIEPDLSLVVDGSPADPALSQVARQLLSIADPPTAIFAVTDVLAIAALQSIASVGLRVPEDISVMGFDDIRMAGLCIPSLTTVAQPIVEKGKLALQMLQERMKQPDLPPRRAVLGVRIIERASTSPPRAPRQKLAAP